MKRLDRYVLLQVASPAVLALAITGFIGVVNELRERVNQLPIAEVTLGDVSRLGALGDVLPRAGLDAALAIEVLCYVEDPLSALRELARVTRPGGWIAVSVEGLYGALLGIFIATLVFQTFRFP